MSYYTKLSDIEKYVIKSSTTYIFIAGSSAYGEAFHPHFQLSTKAKTQDREIIKIAMMIHMVKTVGKFGLSAPNNLCVTV